MKALIIGGLVGASCQLVAHTMEERLTELETQMEEVGARNPQGIYGAAFTSASPDTEHDWFLTIEPLYWHAKVGGTEYAYTDKELRLTTEILRPPIKGRFKDQEFGWDWGLRVGVGHIFPHDEWDVYATYTWYQTSDTDSVFKDVPSVIFPIRQTDLHPSKLVKSRFNLDYNNVNVELGRHDFISSKVSVRPHIGVKSAWIYEKQNIRATKAHINFGSGQGHDLKTRDKTILWGIGPRMGVDGECAIGDGFSFYAKLAGALLYGYSVTSYHQTADNEITVEDENQRIHLRGKNHLFVPTAQMFLGLIWKTYMNEHRQHLTLGAGYEVEYYWRANQMMIVDDMSTFFGQGNPRRIQLDRLSEDVMFYGLTLKARLNF